MLDTAIHSNNNPPEETIRVALLVEYCGKDFRGSQFQPAQPTVQHVMQEALSRLNLKTSAVSFAGRTDTGVNAQGQVAHFDVALSALDNIPHLPAALNAVLPDTVAVRDARINTGLHFNSRRDADCKWYRYTIHNAPTRSVWASRAASMHHRLPLDAKRMNQAAKLLIGTHDFQSFKDSDNEMTNNTCHVRYAHIARNDDFITFDIVADRFLYKMVRNLAGQLMTIGHAENPLPSESILDVMHERNRTKAAFTARPEGLALMAIQYKSPFNFFEKDAHVRQLQQILKQTEMESLQNENLFRKAS